MWSAKNDTKSFYENMRQALLFYCMWMISRESCFYVLALVKGNCEKLHISTHFHPFHPSHQVNHVDLKHESRSPGEFYSIHSSYEGIIEGNCLLYVYFSWYENYILLYFPTVMNINLPVSLLNESLRLLIIQVYLLVDCMDQESKTASKIYLLTCMHVFRLYIRHFSPKYTCSYDSL